METYSHRGIGLGRENTLSAAQAAIELGIHFEIDVFSVRTTRRGIGRTLVHMHDNTLDRTTNAKGNVEDTTYKKLRRVRVGDQRIPRLDETLQLLQGMPNKAILDSKNGAGLDILALVEEYGLTSQVHFSSEDPEELTRIKAHNPDASVGLVVNEPLSDEIVYELVGSNLSYLSPPAETLTPSVIQTAHEKGFFLLPWFDGQHVFWSPEEEALVRQLDKQNVHGLIVNHPYQVLAILGQNK